MGRIFSLLALPIAVGAVTALGGCASCEEASDDDPDWMPPPLPEPPPLPSVAPLAPGELTEVIIHYGQWGLTELVGLRHDGCFYWSSQRGISDGTDDFPRYAVTSCTGCLRNGSEAFEPLRPLSRLASTTDGEPPVIIDLGPGPPAPVPVSRHTASLSFVREGTDGAADLTTMPDPDPAPMLLALHEAMAETIGEQREERCVDFERGLMGRR